MKFSQKIIPWKQNVPDDRLNNNGISKTLINSHLCQVMRGVEQPYSLSECRYTPPIALQVFGTGIIGIRRCSLTLQYMFSVLVCVIYEIQPGILIISFSESTKWMVISSELYNLKKQDFNTFIIDSIYFDLEGSWGVHSVQNRIKFTIFVTV